MIKCWLLIMGFLLGGCLGGGGGSAPPATSTGLILSWEQPPLRVDNTALDVQKDVSRWDIYCTFYPTFTDNDIVASVARPDNLAFNLDILRAHGIIPGPDGSFVAVKCVDTDNQVSDFSEPVEWGGPAPNIPTVQ